MGKLIEGNFPENNQSSFEDPNIIDGRFLIGPFSRVSQIIFGRRHLEDAFEDIEIFDSGKDASMQLNYDTLEIDAPLDWLSDISIQAEEEHGPNFAELVQTHLFTTIYAKKWINKLDNNKKRKKLLNINVATEYIVGRTKFDITYSNAHELEMWRAASAIALKTISHRGKKDRTQLLEFLDAQYAIETELELEQQGFKTHRHLLKRLVDNKKPYHFNSYRVGTLAPMSDEELAGLAPEFIRAANS